jgi:heat shock protein 1/8
LLQVYEGEHSETHKNNLLEMFNLTGIPPAPRGVPEIEVVFDVASNGIPNVSAALVSPHKQKDIAPENAKGPSNKRLLSEAEKRKEEEYFNF